MRIIIRFSIDGERNSSLRNKLNGTLERAGIARQPNTATYEGQATQPEIATLLGAFWNTAATHRGHGRVDHFWMYTDRSEIDNLLGAADPVEAERG